MDAVVRWTDGLQCVGHGRSGHGVLVDAAPEVEGFDLAARPVELFLISLCSCTGMDVVSILNKMRVRFERFEVGARGERRGEHPKAFERIELRYRFWGAQLDPEKLEKAITLSLERYCPIAHMVKAAVPLSYRVELNPPRPQENGGQR